jgi:hypothetical protein
MSESGTTSSRSTSPSCSKLPTFCSTLDQNRLIAFRMAKASVNSARLGSNSGSTMYLIRSCDKLMAVAVDGVETVCLSQRDGL